MIKPCSSPGCCTLTYGDICLGCLQRRSKSQHEAAGVDVERHSADESAAGSASVAA
jgi:hypothetical protein